MLVDDDGDFLVELFNRVGQILNLAPESHKPLNGNDLEDGAPATCTPTCTPTPDFVTRFVGDDVELARLIEAWPTLPKPIKRAILTLAAGFCAAD